VLLNMNDYGHSVPFDPQYDSGGSDNMPLFLSLDQQADSSSEVDFEDPKIASLPRLLLMGPRRGGKTSIQVSVLVCKK
jgi:hypothetical protein